MEGLTEFRLGQKPSVKISALLAEDEGRKNRLRTTLTHEYGHVHFHAYLWEPQSLLATAAAVQALRDEHLAGERWRKELDADGPDGLFQFTTACWREEVGGFGFAPVEGKVGRS